MKLFPFALAAALCAGAQTPDTVFLEELTWTEVRDALKAGKTTIIVPTGGTEQNGPHMILGKHNFRIHYTANLIARQVGKTLVAPVMAYVPEGRISPPEGHMRMAGTISIPDDVFRKVLESTARSLAQHGFRDIVFIGDSGPNQPGMKAVAEMLNAEWPKSGARVHFIPEYYAKTDFDEFLLKQGETKADIGTHAGIKDTSLLLAVDPKLVRKDKIKNGGGFQGSGVTGNPERASIAYGRKGIELMVNDTAQRIRAAIKASRQ